MLYVTFGVILKKRTNNYLIVSNLKRFNMIYKQCLLPNDDFFEMLTNLGQILVSTGI